jgi:hypothetical protein
VSTAFDLLRPDDLVALHVHAVNLRLDASRPAHPRLVVEKATEPALLIFQFQPQTFAEQAFFQTSAFTPPTFNPPPVPPPQASDDPLLSSGSIDWRMGGDSRLVFRLPKGLTEIAYSTEALLDWSRLELVLSPTAAVPDGATPKTPPPIAEPGAQETALELPYRLVLSPTALGGGSWPGWRSAQRPVTHAGRSELWHTRLVRVRPGLHGAAPAATETTERDPLPLRAIWSPDFVADEPLPLHSEDDLPFRSAMTPRDRAQLVILTSGYEGYLQKVPGTEKAYEPQPVRASKLYLSALGGWLSSDGTWPDGVFYRFLPFLPVPLAPPAPREARAIAPPAVQPLDLVAWRHVATQGRDHYVRIVYDGYLWPFGNRASLIKVTERGVKTADGVIQTSPTAYMRQRMYIVVREPERDFGNAPYTHHGLEMPLQKVRIDTKTTPDIDPPSFIPGTAASFWVDVGPGHFPFKVTATDIAVKQIDFLAPMIFVSLSETEIGDNADKTKGVRSAYLLDDEERRCSVKGLNVAYADPNAGDTTFKTTALYFDVQITNTGPPPWDTPPFLPFLDFASVTVPSIAELLGRQVAVLIGYYAAYLQNGLDPNAGVFAQIIQAPPGIGFSADKSGGLATPNISLTALSARKGLVSGSPDHAAAGQIKPSEYFGATDAQLFGTIPLSGLIPVDPNTLLANADVNAPEIRNRLLPTRRHPTQSVTKIHWAPQIKSYSKDPVEVEFDNTSTLTLDVTLTRQLDGSPPTSAAKGVLSNFRLSLLGVVALKLVSITFTSQNAQKTIVTAKLDSAHPIVFEGPLSFIQTLADILPPGLFGGEGPTIQALPTYLRVTYTLGLPTIACGVFSLQGIAVLTGLDLPYLDGKPGFEFGFATRNRPFLVTVEIFGGGGFVHVVLNADGVQMVEGAIEFGGNFAFDIGVASGGVHAMAGIYFQLKGQTSDLTGFVDIGGEVSVLGLISISLDLNLSLSWEHSPSGDVIDGKATMTVSVHVLFFSASVQISVERSFKAGGGDPQIWQLVDQDQWRRYAAAFA